MDSTKRAGRRLGRRFSSDAKHAGDGFHAYFAWRGQCDDANRSSRGRNPKMLKIGIVVGSTRPGRKAGAVAEWVLGLLRERKDAEFEIVDIGEYKLPLLDEPVPPMMHQYSKPHTQKWSEKIVSLDGFVFVTPEYNHSTSAALKNAIDFLFHEWNNKAAGFVAYGSAGGVRAVEHLRLVMGEIKVADVRAQVALSLFSDFENFTVFKPHEQHAKSVHAVADEVVAWSGALKPLRETAAK
jgi:NAD(P)H-dependent FMN reductase